MTFCWIVIIVATAGSIISSTVSQAVPSSPPGFTYYVNGTLDDATVEVDFFIDLMCPDSKVAWPVMTQVATDYGPIVKLTVHPFPLVFHRAAYITAKATFVEVGYPPDEKQLAKIPNWFCFKWIEKVFSFQEKFYNDPSFKKSDEELIREFARLAGSMNVNPSYFSRAVQSDQIDTAARMAWKYGCTHGVGGTPWYFVNGIMVNAGDWTVDKWHNFIDTLINNGH